MRWLLSSLLTGSSANTMSKWEVERSLAEALATERLFPIRDQLDYEIFDRRSFTMDAANDVATFANATFEMYSRGLMNEEDEKYFKNRIGIIGRTSLESLSGLATFFDEDEDGDDARMLLKPFSYTFDFIWPRLPAEFKKEISIGKISTDLLSKVKIGQYLQESLYHDMVYLVERTNGKYPLNEARLQLRASVATNPLAQATIDILKDPNASQETLELITNFLIYISGENGMNRRHLSRLNLFLYRGGRIAAFSELIESLLGEDKLILKGFLAELRLKMSRGSLKDLI